MSGIPLSESRSQDLASLLRHTSIKMDEAKADMEDTFAQIRELNQIKLKQATIRNIIFVGRSRTGKSTALRVLKDPLNQVERGSLYSDTKFAKIYPFTVENMTSADPERPGAQREICYNINIIDTPGLFEVKAMNSKEEARSDEQIQDIIAKCMEHEITKVHCIFFVCNFDTGVTKADIDAFTRFREIFQGAEDAIAMLITNAESYSEANKQRIIDELMKHAQMSEFMTQFKNRVFFTGSISKSDCDNNITDAVRSYSQNVLAMRRTIYEYIFSCHHPFQLDDMKLFKADKIKVDQLRNDIAQCHKVIDSLVEGSEQKKIKQQEMDNLLEQLSQAKAFIMQRIGEKQTRESLSAVRS